MAVPDFQTLMLPVLNRIAVGEISTRDLVGQISEEFDLSDEDRAELLPSGKQTRIANRTNWTITYLNKAGLVRRVRRGVYSISDTGRELVKHPPKTINVQFLKEHYQGVRDFTQRPNEGEPETIISNETSLVTPQEQIDAAYDEIKAALSIELLQQVLELSPEAFEQLIVDLMLGMGYGAGGQGRRIGQSGDGGVDGVISEDRLGLDVVYLQAKRYAPENKVGSGQLREFIGALAIRRASKGVFVTTSSFSNSAISEAERSGSRVILIDGKRLSSLMIQYDVGVRLASRVDIKEIDLNYFDSD